MKRYTKEQIQFVANNVKGRSRKEMIILFKAQFGVELSNTQMASLLKNHKLKSETNRYTEEEIKFIAANIKGRGYRELTDMFNEHFTTNKTVDSITTAACSRGLNNGLNRRIAKGEHISEATQFPKGHTPWNKGKKGTNFGGKETQFKKGQQSWNYKPVGSERINGDGYVDIKIADPNKWKAKHVIIWEEANGPVPEGHCLIFADRNPLNVTLDNLMLITRGQLGIMNKRGLISTDAEITKTGLILANIYKKIRERKRKK